jgi:hypothetical protein
MDIGLLMQAQHGGPMKVKERKGWKSLDKDFEKWYKDHGSPDWKSQKRWLSKELVKRSFIKEEQLPEMWVTFQTLTSGCSLWKVQSKILSFITLCLNEEIGEDLDSFVQ